MRNLAFMLLKQLRMPLIALILVYAVTVLGFVLIPGQDNQGQPWRMDFLHAFYFVSYMATTIGFGELPYPFTAGQRMWTIFTIYATVTAWLYSIGAMLGVIQEPAFRRMVKQYRFETGVRRITEPFYLVCGYGDGGQTLVQGMSHRGIMAVVIDDNPERVDLLQTRDLNLTVPGLCADAAAPATLIDAGLKHPWCMGVIAVTNNDHTNLMVAITSNLLAPEKRVICRANSKDTAANMTSFGTNYVILPFHSFAERFAEAIHSPSLYSIYEWMTAAGPQTLVPSHQPPRGKWILCGYGRFGKAMQQALSFEGQHTVLIEADPIKAATAPGTILGRGTEAETLLQAGIEDAVGIIAGTDNDANNLSIIMTARDLRPTLFTVMRQSQRRNDLIVQAARPDIIMQPGVIIARKVLGLILNPLLGDFLGQAMNQNEAWASALVKRIRDKIGEGHLVSWVLDISPTTSPALASILQKGVSLQITHLIHDRRDPTLPGQVVPLLLKSGTDLHLLPDEGHIIQQGDMLLFGGTTHAETDMQWIVNNHNVLEFMINGIEPPRSFVMRQIKRHETR